VMDNILGIMGNNLGLGSGIGIWVNRNFMTVNVFSIQ